MANRQTDMAEDFALKYVMMLKNIYTPIYL